MLRIFLLASLFSIIVIAQQANKAEYIEYKNEFMRGVEKESADFQNPPKAKAKSFKVDYRDMQLPKSKSEFTQFWHFDPVNQGITGTCWSFSTTSFIESEMFRIHKEKIKLSPIFTVYWEYVEKAMGYILSHGNTSFGEGSQANALFRAYKKYGIVPESAYSGMLPGQKVHDHSKLSDEIQAYLKNVKVTNTWDPETNIKNIKAILNFYLTEPPVRFVFEGKEYSPEQFYKERVRINVDDYRALVSFTDEPYYTFLEYKVTDNWWHSKEYFNVPLPDYMEALQSAINKGYTMCLAGDVSEPGIHSAYKVAAIPAFDIPSEFITAEARQFRFTNGTTGDDHGIHVVGYKQEGGKYWYLIKDSGSGSFNVGDKGYYFFHEDYIKLKMLGIILHKDAIPNIIAKMKTP